MVQESVIVKSSISRQIAEQLREAIVDGRFKIGDRLPTEDELAQRYGVSRPSVREALKGLAAQNLVRARRGPSGGNFVIQPSHEGLAESLSASATLLVGMGALDISEIMEARRALQGSCLKLVVKNAMLNISAKSNRHYKGRRILRLAMKIFVKPMSPFTAPLSMPPIMACYDLSCTPSSRL